MPPAIVTPCSPIVQQPEVLILVERVFVMFTQVVQIIGVVEIFELRGIAPEFLVVAADRARILHSAVDHFRFLIPPDLKFNCGIRCQREYAHQGDHEQ